MDTVRRLWDDCCKSLSNKNSILNRTEINKRQSQHNHDQHLPQQQQQIPQTQQQHTQQQIPQTQLQHNHQQTSQTQQQHTQQQTSQTQLQHNHQPTSQTQQQHTQQPTSQIQHLQQHCDPNLEDFEARYNALISDLGLDERAKETLLGFSREKKVNLYRQISNTNERVSYSVEMLENFCKTTCQTSADSQTATLERLRALLRSGRVSFVRDFLVEGGLTALLSVIQTVSKKYPYHRINEVVMGCLKSSMNCQEGRKMVLRSDKAVKVVAEMSVSALNRNEKARVVAVSILSGLCMVPGGHSHVLSAFNHVQDVAFERCRFQSLIGDLASTPSTHLTLAILALINSLINYAPGLNLLEFRLHLRYELLMLGLNSVLERVKRSNNSLYDKHIEFFEMVRRRDEKEFYDKSSTSKKRVDSKSVSAMADHLRRRHLLSPTYPHLLSILYHLVLIPHDSPWTVQRWRLIDKSVQEMVVPQSEEGETELTQNEREKELGGRSEEREKQVEELQEMLQKKEKEVLLRAEEKNILLETLSELKVKLETEAEEHRRQLNGLLEQLREARKSGRILGGNDDDDLLGDDVVVEDGGDIVAKRSLKNSTKLKDRVKTGLSEALGDSSKLIGEGSRTHDGFKDGIPADDVAASSNQQQQSSPIPPSSPLLGAPTPPPLPPLFHPLTPLPSKNIPQPKQRTKCFNWTKVPDSRIAQTIWHELSDQQIYKLIDFEELEGLFSAYQRSQQTTQGCKSGVKELSLMDGRRSQNCNIMLAKLKMSNDQLIEALTSGDPGSNLSRDVCDQLLKFVPSSEETSLLKEHASESCQMAKPDLFLFRISQVEHYEAMLKGIIFTKKFNERVTDLSSGMKAVLEASEVCVKSVSFRRLLEIVLAVGNFMNGASRGNASGFKLASLGKLQDTKAADHKSTLLHYLVQLCSDKFSETSTLHSDLCSTRGASKVNLQEVDGEMRTLGTGLKELDTEAKYEEGRNEGFSRQMKEFLQVSSCRYDNLHQLSIRMKKQYNEMLRNFCEESSVQPDECFKPMVALLDSMTEARKENLALKKQQEEEEAKVLREAELRSGRERRKYSSSTIIAQEEDMGEFDAMIRTLMTGDAYDGTMGRGKRSNVRKLSFNPSEIIYSEDSENTVNYRRTKQSKSLASILESRERISQY